jgi:hypothetical protein
MILKRFPFAVVLAGLCLYACMRAGGASNEGAWHTLVQPSSLDGWTISTASPHGDTKAWTVKDGVVEGTQDKTGNGGIIYSAGQYGNFILELELNPDAGLDSGIFLRSTPEGKCYQIMVDNYDKGDIGGIYGEGLGGFIQRTENWKEVFKQDEWNKLVAVVTGNPPAIEVWLNGHHVTSWRDDERRLDDRGHIALQVHKGDRYEGLKTRFRNVRLRELD